MVAEPASPPRRLYPPREVRLRPGEDVLPGDDQEDYVAKHYRKKRDIKVQKKVHSNYKKENYQERAYSDDKKTNYQAKANLDDEKRNYQEKAYDDEKRNYREKAYSDDEKETIRRRNTTAARRRTLCGWSSIPRSRSMYRWWR